MAIFDNKTLLITGGTGSFGISVLDRFLSSSLSLIKIFSRDEQKQNELRKRYKNPKLQFIIGDVRSYDSILSALDGVDFVFHAAALKQVPSCEFFPMEALNTNVIGTNNVIKAAISKNVKKVICLSTDKAVYPINAMGLTKALMEKIAIRASQNDSKTIVCVTRYGNVMASRGSVIPLFLDQINKNLPVTVTNPNMTRFMMSLDEAVDLVTFAFNNGKNGDLFVQKSPSSTVDNLVNAIKVITNKPNHPVEYIGSRHGEKLYETLLSSEELSKAIDMGGYYKVEADKRDLNYSSYLETGDLNTDLSKEYNSHNTTILDVDELVSLLLKLPLFHSKKLNF